MEKGSEGSILTEQSSKSKIWTIPNVLTTIRLMAIPFMAFFIYQSGQPGAEGQRYGMLSFIFFVTIWVTDMADGFIARRFNQVSDFGKIYDPLVDKLFQFTTAFMMLMINRIPLWVVLFILVKELTMLIVGAYLWRSKRVVVHAKWYGKAATVLFVLALAVVFFIPYEQRYLTNYIFILPVAMSSFAALAYGYTLLKHGFSAKESSENESERNENN